MAKQIFKMRRFQKKRSCKSFKNGLKMKRKLKYMKNQRAGNNIIDDDIMYKDYDVCILKPLIKKGIIVYTDFNQPKDEESLCKKGLKTGKQMHEENILFGKSIYHPYIFFQAPFQKRDIDYTSFETELNSLYGESAKNLIKKKNCAFIRVDPHRTYVYSSEIRAKYHGSDVEHRLKSSRKLLDKYLEIIENNEKMPYQQKMPYYNLITSEKNFYNWTDKPQLPWDSAPIERNTEILVRIPHLTTDYFVKCS